MSTFSIENRVLGARLGLGSLQRGSICHGYANCCVCSECRERANPQPVEAIRQPWELEAA